MDIIDKLFKKDEVGNNFIYCLLGAKSNLLSFIKYYFCKIFGIYKIKVNKLIKKNKIIKINLGCGPNYLDGWINIDNKSGNIIQKLDLNFDSRYKLPFPDNSVSFIYSEHFLEHFNIEQGLNILRNCKNILKPNGVMRIAMPSLEHMVQDYLNPNWKTKCKEMFEKSGVPFIQTRAEYINISFRWWGHQYIYDYEELERRLKEVGFEKIKQCELYNSDYDDLKNLETRKESFVVEVIK